jgi:hypothetical protein
LETLNSPIPNMARKEFEAIISLKLNKDIRILQTDKDSCSVAFVDSEYKYRLNTLLEARFCEYSPTDLTPKFEN